MSAIADTMPPGFRFVLRFGVQKRNEYDSATGMFVVDRVCDPSDTLIVRLSRAEMDTVWRTLATLRFFEYPSELVRPTATPRSNPGRESTTVATGPNFLWDLTVDEGQRHHEVSWLLPYTAHDKALTDFAWKFVHRLWAAPEFVALPRPRCGYL